MKKNGPSFKINGPDDQSSVDRAYKEETTAWKRTRLLVIRLGMAGVYTREEVAGIAGCSIAAVGAWSKLFRKGGLEALLERKSKGRDQCPLSAAQLDAVMEGLREGRWTRIKELMAWVLETYGIELGYFSAYRIMRKLKAKIKVPRRCHAKKKPEDEAAFRENLEEKLDSLELDPNLPVRVWVEDEHRYGLITTARRCWSLPGCRPKTPYRTKYQWEYACAALEVCGNGGFELMNASGVCLGMSRAFLQQIADSDPSAQHVVIWDGAGFHQREKAAQGPDWRDLPPGVKVITLPPYSPELNPAEKLWDMAKDAVANKIFPTMDAIREKVVGEVNQFRGDAKRVAQLVGEGWLWSSVNAS